ncbi:MAG: cytidine deaminase [Gemmatimonadetes bacterium]|nr:cytidine deaminase [Gemmatimonadota bacterium]
MTETLVAAARRAQQQAYAPYSRYQVGAALEAEDGQIYTGCNMENASFGLTICAERTAVATAVTAGARRFRRIAIVVGSEPPAMPCGACRQVLAEFGLDLPGESVGPSTRVSWNLRDLLPGAFGPGNLA